MSEETRLARVEALAEGPTRTDGGYQPYAVELPDGIHLAVLLDDLRAALAEPERDEEPGDPGTESVGIVRGSITGRAMWECSTCGTKAYGFSSEEVAKRDLREHACPATERDEESGR
ncbi:MAG: hypothetical protein ACRDTJ_21085 [Pseudonocardiaceae bacterium]